MKFLSEMNDIGKELSQKEINLKIHKGLPKSWEMKVIDMRDYRHLKVILTSQIFSDLKVHEFEKESRKEDDEPKSATLVADQ